MKKHYFAFLLGLLYSITAFAGNIIGNGDFESGTVLASSYWTTASSSPAAQTISIDNTSQISGTNAIKATIVTAGTYYTRLGFSQAVSLPKVANYTVTFKAKASANCFVTSNFVQSFLPYTTLAAPPAFYLSTSAMSYSYDITSTNSLGLCKLNFYYGDVVSGTTIYIDDISIVEKPGLTNRNLCNGDFETALNNSINTGSYYTANGLAASVTPDANQNKMFDGWGLLRMVHTPTTADFSAGIDSISPIAGAKSIKLTSAGAASTLSSDMIFSWMFAGQKDMYYTLSFKARSSVNTAMDVYLGAASNTGPTCDYISTQACNVSTVTQTFTYTSTLPFLQSADGRAVLKFLLGKVPYGVSIWLDDVTLVRVVPVTAISLSQTPVTISIGSKFPLIATIAPYDAANQAVTWTSSDEAKATVNSSGVVTAVAAGTATISATSNDKGLVATSNVIISATAISVTGVTVSPSMISIAKGAKQQLSTTISPIGATNTSLNWKSDNIAVATVDSAGVVSGIAKGVVTITANAKDGSSFGTASVSVAIPVKGIAINSTNQKLNIGAINQLNPMILPINATNKTVSYSSNKPLVAGVSADGIVSGYSPGTAIITSTSQDGNYTVADTVVVIPQALVLPSVISNNMVMQQNIQAALWGWGPPNEVVSITASWGQVASATADANGKWNAKIQTPKAVAGEVQTKHTLSFAGKNNTVQLTNILIGDVYLCSGQSNMAFVMSPTSGTLGVLDYANEIAAANYPNIRINNPTYNPQFVPVENGASAWNECTPTTIANFPAVPYYFAREIYNNSQINIPIGLLVPAVGGTSCQAWTRREVLAADPLLKSTFLDPSDLLPKNNTTLTNGTSSSVFYNGMIAPLVPFTLKGFLWYQGEANAGMYTPSYTVLNSGMIKDWRASWGQGDLPFYFVQLPAFNNFNIGFRDQQCSILTLPNTGMAVTLDLADADLSNIHPRNKKTVAKRLALIAAANIYGQPVTYAGPVFKSKTIEANKIRISFHPVTLGAGLASRNGLALTNFQIAGSDNKYVDAVAMIDGNDVLVSASSVLSPVNVSFAYTSAAEPNLMNKDSLTACPFKTDTWNNSISFGATVSGIPIAKLAPADVIATIFTIPATDLLHVVFNKPMSHVQIALIDFSGKIRYQTTLENELAEKCIDITGYPKGFYICRIVGKEVNFSKSFILQ